MRGVARTFVCTDRVWCGWHWPVFGGGKSMKTAMISAVAGLAMFAGTPAHAVFVDFTANVWDGIQAGDNTTSSFNFVGGVGVTISSVGGNLDTSESNLPSGALCSTGVGGSPAFACQTDGVGIGIDNNDIDRDEINGDEVLTITLSELVEVTAVYLLDFFFDGASDNQEQADVDFGDNGVDETLAPEEAFNALAPGNGFAPFFLTSAEAATVITFQAGMGNDAAGNGDFAVAGIEFDIIEDRPIPVPAALPLLLTGLIGLGFVGRRRRAAA